MNFIKHILVDVYVTIFIASGVWQYKPWMWWVIAVYTVLIPIAKEFALYSDRLLLHARKKRLKITYFYTFCIC